LRRCDQQIANWDAMFQTKTQVLVRTIIMQSRISKLSYTIQRLTTPQLNQPRYYYDQVAVEIDTTGIILVGMRQQFTTIISKNVLKKSSLLYCRSFGIMSTAPKYRWNSDKTTTTTTTTTVSTRDPPKLTAEMQRDLAILEKRFIRLELEPHGRRRGIEVTQQMLREEKLDKATKAVANIWLNNWIYRRYSLPLGYDKITDVPGDILAHTLIREGTEIRFWKYKNAKTILKEMYRYPQRPTTMQQRYLEKDQKAMNNDGKNDTATPPLTPEEEERERRMWDPRLFRPKLYGYKARREALKRKRQMKK
jgi:hypothetical protein